MNVAHSAKHRGTVCRAAERGLLKLKKLKVDKCLIPFIATVLHPALKLNYFKEQGHSASEIRNIKKSRVGIFY